MQRYKVGPAIGSGQFGKVHIAIHRRTLKRCALKLIPASLPDADALQAEIATHRALTHPNIVTLTDCFEANGEVCVVTEYCANGDLLGLLQEKGRFEVDEVRNVARGLCRGLRYLHERGIVHRDLKLQNILLDDKHTVKICDFGFSRMLPGHNVTLTSVKGTPIYMAPELIRERPYSHAIDLWAMGIILYELFVGMPPFYANSIFKLVNLILEEDVKWPADMPSDLRDLLERLLKKEPEERMGWPELRRHPFIMGDVEGDEAEGGGEGEREELKDDDDEPPKTTTATIPIWPKRAKDEPSHSPPVAATSPSASHPPLDAYAPAAEEPTPTPNTSTSTSTDAWHTLLTSPNSDLFASPDRTRTLTRLLITTTTKSTSNNTSNNIPQALDITSELATTLTSQPHPYWLERLPAIHGFLKGALAWIVGIVGGERVDEDVKALAIEVYVACLECLQCAAAWDLSVASPAGSRTNSRPSSVAGRTRTRSTEYQQHQQQQQQQQHPPNQQQHISHALLRTIAQTFLPLLPRLFQTRSDPPHPKICTSSLRATQRILSLIKTCEKDEAAAYARDVLDLGLVPVIIDNLAANDEQEGQVTAAVRVVACLVELESKTLVRAVLDTLLTNEHAVARLRNVLETSEFGTVAGMLVKMGQMGGGRADGVLKAVVSVEGCEKRILGEHEENVNDDGDMDEKSSCILAVLLLASLVRADHADKDHSGKATPAVSLSRRIMDNMARTEYSNLTVEKCIVLMNLISSVPDAPHLSFDIQHQHHSLFRWLYELAQKNALAKTVTITLQVANGDMKVTLNVAEVLVPFLDRCLQQSSQILDRESQCSVMEDIKMLVDRGAENLTRKAKRALMKVVYNLLSRELRMESETRRGKWSVSPSALVQFLGTSKDQNDVDDDDDKQEKGNQDPVTDISNHVAGSIFILAQQQCRDLSHPHDPDTAPPPLFSTDVLDALTGMVVIASASTQSTALPLMILSHAVLNDMTGDVVRDVMQRVHEEQVWTQLLDVGRHTEDALVGAVTFLTALVAHARREFRHDLAANNPGSSIPGCLPPLLIHPSPALRSATCKLVIAVAKLSRTSKERGRDGAGLDRALKEAGVHGLLHHMTEAESDEGVKACVAEAAAALVSAVRTCAE